jgi:hypothetical protein
MTIYSAPMSKKRWKLIVEGWPLERRGKVLLHFARRLARELGVEGGHSQPPLYWEADLHEACHVATLPVKLRKDWFEYHKQGGTLGGMLSSLGGDEQAKNEADTLALELEVAESFGLQIPRAVISDGFANSNAGEMLLMPFQKWGPFIEKRKRTIQVRKGVASVLGSFERFYDDLRKARWRRQATPMGQIYREAFKEGQGVKHLSNTSSPSTEARAENSPDLSA